jgi:hypothetical protein
MLTLLQLAVQGCWIDILVYLAAQSENPFKKRDRESRLNFPTLVSGFRFPEKCAAGYFDFEV